MTVALPPELAMPTIIAICPYCRAGGVRAAANAIGASATCPKCRNSFTVLPEENLPEWAANAKPNVNSFSAPTGEKPKLADETHGSGHRPDVTEPSPKLPAEKPPKTKETKDKPKDAKSETSGGSPRSDAEPKPKPESTEAAGASTSVPTTSVAAPGAEESDDEPTGPRDVGMVFALLALILVGPAVVASQFPYGRFIALPLIGVGLLGGLLSLGAEGKARLAAATAAFIHLILLLVVLFLPSWLDLDPWRGPPPPEEPKGPMMVQHGSGVPVLVKPTDWIEANQSSWVFKDTRVTVRSSLGPVELTGPNNTKKTTKERYLHLIIQVANVGVSREIPLTGWAVGPGPEGIRVTDPKDHVLAPANFEGGFAPERGRPIPKVPPGQASEVVFMFAAPAPKSEFVRVQLPGSALGTTDEIKFQIGALGLIPGILATPGTPGK